MITFIMMSVRRMKPLALGLMMRRMDININFKKILNMNI